MSSSIALNITKKFTASSTRVKYIDLHPKEPWIISSLYSGVINIYNYKTQSILKTIEVCEYPIRVIKYYAPRQWLIMASDDFYVRVYNIVTLECVEKWISHKQYIRGMAIHPKRPLLLTCSDDCTIKLWNLDSFGLMRTFEGHTNYVMCVVVNPKDANTFASASLDGTIKIWNLGSSSANYTLEGHTRGVNCLDYYRGNDKPYLVSGSDDSTIRIWDYQTKTCVSVLEGHTDNVNAVAFHPDLPVILSGGEDETFRIWNTTTYRLERLLDYGLERIWCISCLRGLNGVAIAYDLGTVFVRLFKGTPCASMDSTGKVLIARNNVLLFVNVSHELGARGSFSDGEALGAIPKELITCEFYPQFIRHSPNGRFVVVMSFGEYVIYTALTVRAQKFGNAIDFVWEKSGGFAIRTKFGLVTVFDKKFVEIRTFKFEYPVDCIFGGHLLAIKSHQTLYLYDWISGQLVRKVDVTCKLISWNDRGSLVAIATDVSFFLLQYDTNSSDPNEVLTIVAEIPEKLRSCCWINDCLVYINNFNVIKYLVGSKSETVTFLNHPMLLLGYLADTEKIILIDKSLQIFTHSLSLTLIKFHSAIFHHQLDLAHKLLADMEPSQRLLAARILASLGHLSWSLEITPDPDHKFELALQLNQLELAFDIASHSNSEHKWQELGHAALLELNLPLAEKCLWNSGDYQSLFALFSCTNNSNSLLQLAFKTSSLGLHNITFLCYFLLNKIDLCLQLLTSSNLLPDAVLLSHSYLPSHLPQLINSWKLSLHSSHPKYAQKIAHPDQYPNLFPHLTSLNHHHPNTP